MSQIPAVIPDHYYRHAELTDFLQQAAAAAPEQMRLHNLCTTAEGREEWLAEITDFSTGDPADKPGYLVQANLHAPEVSGTTASLVLIRRLLTDPAQAELLQRVVFYIIPRLNPDGAEYALVTGGQIRSKFELLPCRNGLLPGDLNGDGRVLSMRWPDPYGPFRCDDLDPRIMVHRRPGDSGPFYQVFPEGQIHDYDGGPVQWATRGFDFNRNWGYNWQPEHVQGGAGDYAFSNPEMKAVADWVYSHPNIFGMLGFHNGCNSVLRPSATTADSDLPPADLQAFKELGEIGARLTGFGLRAVRDYHTDGAPPISLKGHFTDWTYFSLGLLAYEIELGNSYNSAGISTEEYFAADDHTREVLFMRRLLHWLDQLGGEPRFHDWTPVAHPQLGEVEVGGLTCTDWACPLAGELLEIGERCADFIFTHADRHPRLEIGQAAVQQVEGQIYRVTATVANTGALPTNITLHGLGLAHRPPVTVRLEGSAGVEVLSRQALTELPQLSRLGGHQALEWFVRVAQPGSRLTITARHPRALDAEVVLRIE
jgi:hypothetical protein